MQDFFPKTLHPLHIFEEDNVLYAADLEKARIVKLSIVMAEILKFSETRTNQEIQQALGNSYQEEDISEAFERFAELEKAGLLFNRGEDLQSSLVMASKWRKLLVVIPDLSVGSFFDIETLYAGTNMALSHMFQHLIKHVHLHFAGNQNRKLADAVYEVDINVQDLGRLSRKIGETYFGILTLHRDHERWLFPLYKYIELPPILVQCHAPRGHGGKAMNSFYDTTPLCEIVMGSRHPRIMFVNFTLSMYGNRVSLIHCQTVSIQNCSVQWIRLRRNKQSLKNSEMIAL